jgi:hypothetical protein
LGDTGRTLADVHGDSPSREVGPLSEKERPFRAEIRGSNPLGGTTPNQTRRPPFRGGLTAVVRLLDNSFAASDVSEEPAELRCGVSADARHDVGVHVEGHLRMRMAKALLHRLDVEPERDEQRPVSVAQLVEVHRRVGR